MSKNLITPQQPGAKRWFEEIPVLFISFLLTSILGAYFGSWLQDQSFRSQHEAELLDETKREAFVVFNDLSALAETRWFVTLRLYRNLQNQHLDDIKIEQRREKYRAIVDEWNAKNTRLLTLLGWYFGAKFETAYERQISNELISIGNALQKEANIRLANHKKHELPMFDSRMDKVRLALRKLQRDMIKQIKGGPLENKKFPTSN